MNTMLLLMVLYGIAFMAALLSSAGHPARFASLLIAFAFMVSVIYWTILPVLLNPQPTLF